MIDHVVTYGAGHFYIARPTRAVDPGRDIDMYNSYAQRGVADRDHVLTAGLAMVPQLRACACWVLGGSDMTMTQSDHRQDAFGQCLSQRRLVLAGSRPTGSGWRFAHTIAEDAPLPSTPNCRSAALKPAISLTRAARADPQLLGRADDHLDALLARAVMTRPLYR